MTSVNSKTDIDFKDYFPGIDPLDKPDDVPDVDTVPTSNDMTLGDLIDLLGLPDIPASMRVINIDTILTAISDEDRRNNIKGSVNSIEAKGSEQKLQNDKKLGEIKQQIEKMEKQTFWQKLLKVFQIIGAIFGLIASAATIGIGAVTSNPALVIAGVVAAIATIDSIVSIASDGKYNIAAGFSALGKKMGMSEEAAKWFGFGMNMLIVVAGVIASFGAAAGSASKIADSSSKFITLLVGTTVGSNIVAGTTGLVQGAGSIYLGVLNKQIADSKAKNVDIDAILEQLRLGVKVEQDFIESQLEAANNIIEYVKEIVDDCGEAATTILTGNPTHA